MWSEVELNILKNFGAFYSSEELMQFIPSRTSNAIRNKRKDLNIHLTKATITRLAKKSQANVNPLIKFKMNQNLKISDLNNHTYQILMGSMLGDGCIICRPNSDCYIFKETHSNKQIPYLKWKHKIFNQFHPTLAVASTVSGFENSDVPYMELQTVSSPIFKELRDEFYAPTGNIHRKLYMPEHHMNKLDPLGLLVWYLDDGNNNIKNGIIYPRIGIRNFSLKSLNNFTEIFNNKYNMELYVRENTWNEKVVKTVIIPARSRNKLIPIWKEYFNRYRIPNCMLYKLGY